ncbi:Na+/H+ antiporter, partial [Tieghemiomyces parasiticus]
ILANSVIKGRFAEKRVPRGLRNILAAESGSNDGLGFPLLYLALFLMIYPNDLGTAIGKWFYLAWAYEVLLSVVIGAAVGYAARKLLYLAESHCLIDKESFLSFSIALTLLLLGVVGLIASDDLLSVFCAGTAFAWDDWFRKETKEAHLQEVIDMLFNLTFFIYFGAIIPWHMYNIPSMNLHLWRFFVATICILIFRRLPALVLLCKFIPAIKTWREAIFAGWFGPIGVGALYYITVARRYMEDHDINPPSYDVIYPIVSFVVMGSVLVHGITIPLFHLGSALNTRTLTNNSVIGNFVSRLPMVRSGQNLELRRPDGEATSFTITGVKRLDDLDAEAAPSGRDGDKAGDGPAYAHVRELTIDAERNHHGSRTSTASPYYNGEDDEPEYLEIRVVESDQPFHGANSDDRTGSATQPHLHPPPNPTLRFEDLDNESSRLSSSLRGSPFLSADDSLSHKRSSVSFGQDGEK